MIFQLSCRTEYQEPLKSTADEMHELHETHIDRRRRRPERSPPLFCQDLNCFPNSVARCEDSGSQQIQQCASGLCTFVFHKSAELVFFVTVLITCSIKRNKLVAFQNAGQSIANSCNYKSVASVYFTFWQVAFFNIYIYICIWYLTERVKIYRQHGQEEKKGSIPRCR